MCSTLRTLRGEWNLSELEFVRIRSLPLFEGIGNCQNWKMSELEIVRIGNCQNRKLSESEIVRIGISQYWKMSDLEIIRILKRAK